MKKLIVPALLAVLWNSAVISAQTGAIPTKQFETAYDAYIRTTLDKIPDVPGVAIVVVKDDKPIFLKAYGMADREAGIKARRLPATAVERNIMVRVITTSYR